jgi:hypothetical protein
MARTRSSSPAVRGISDGSLWANTFAYFPATLDDMRDMFPVNRVAGDGVALSMLSHIAAQTSDSIFATNTDVAVRSEECPWTPMQTLDCRPPPRPTPSVTPSHHRLPAGVASQSDLSDTDAAAIVGAALAAIPIAIVYRRRFEFCPRLTF